jgi:hypothetical protein
MLGSPARRVFAPKSKSSADRVHPCAPRRGTSIKLQRDCERAVELVGLRRSELATDASDRRLGHREQVVAGDGAVVVEIARRVRLLVRDPS